MNQPILENQPDEMNQRMKRNPVMINESHRRKKTNGNK